MAAIPVLLAADPAPPAGVIARLGSESYPERVAAQNELRGWCGEAGGGVSGALLKVASGVGDPEARELLLEVVKDEVLSELEKGRPGFLGILMRDAEEGVLVGGVVEGMPGGAAGLKAGDVIISVDDQELNVAAPREMFGETVGAKTPGEEIHLKLKRQDEVIDLRVRLAARPWSPLSPDGTLDPALEAAERERLFREWLEEKAQKEKPGPRR